MTERDKSKLVLLEQLATFKNLLSADFKTLENKIKACEDLIESDSDGAINKFNEIVAFLANIQDSQSLEGIISGISSQISVKYTKPSTGIPLTDLVVSVQDSLAKADSAIQQHQDISNKANVGDSYTKEESDAKYLTEHQDLSDYAKTEDIEATYQEKGDYALKSEIPSLEGYATEEWVSGKGYLTKHQDISGKADKATTLAGYGITDAKIADGMVTLGTQTITPLTSHQDVSGKVDKETGKGLSTNDYSNEDKAVVDALAYTTAGDIEALFEDA